METGLDDLVALAAALTGAPIALFAMASDGGHAVRASVGLPPAALALPLSFCAHVARADGFFEVADAQADARFAADPIVVGPPHVRHGAGVPVVEPTGQSVAALCVFDTCVRTLAPGQVAGLERLARLAAVRATELAESERRFQELFEFAPDAIVIADRSGTIVRVNRQAEALFGYARTELVGRLVEHLMPMEVRAAHVGRRQRFLASAEPRAMGGGNWGLRALRKDGTMLPVEISLSPMGSDARFVAAAIRDVSERRRADEAVRASLREKETLLKEIHHRVKNNLQIVSSLLMLQSEGAADEATRALLLETVHRVRSMALVHERLYHSETLARIEFSEYIRSLAAILFRAYGAPARVRLEVEAQPAEINIETAVPIGLALNELVSNALRHAFRAGDPGTLRVTLEHVGAGFVLTVADSGPGLPPDVDVGTARTLGLSLVQMLVGQLKGELVVGREGGASFRIAFRELHYAAR